MRKIPRAEAAITQYSRKYASVGLSDMGWVEVQHNIDDIAWSIDQMRLMIDDRRFSVLRCLSLSRCLLSPSLLSRSSVLMIDDD